MPRPDAGPALDPARLQAEPVFDLGIFDAPRRNAMAETGKPGRTRAHHSRPAEKHAAASSIAS